MLNRFDKCNGCIEIDLTGQIRITRYPNGYRETRTRFVIDPGGRPIEDGQHEAWFVDGTRRERGAYELGQRVGPWEFWNEDGTLDEARSGNYEDGTRVGGLP